jgi:hypothetical protein
MSAPSRKQSTAESDLASDAWSRFERAVDVVAKSPPQPKIGGATKHKDRSSKRKEQPTKRK